MDTWATAARIVLSLQLSVQPGLSRGLRENELLLREEELQAAREPEPRK